METRLIWEIPEIGSTGLKARSVGIWVDAMDTTSVASMGTRCTWGVLLVLAICAFLAGLEIWYTTSRGLGVVVDSTQYVTCARNLLAGRGLRTRVGPLKYFPPGYPGMLAIGGLTGVDPLVSGRWLHVALHALLGSLLVWVAYLVTRHSVLGAALMMGLFLTTEEILPLSSAAVSDVPFFVFVPLTLLCMARGLAVGSTTLILIAFIMGATSIIVRPVGLALWPVLALLLLLFGPGSTSRRWVILIVGSVITITPFALWLMWSLRATGTLTGRQSAFNWLTRHDLTVFFTSLARFILPVPRSIQAVAFKPVTGGVLVIGILAMAYSGSLFLRQVRAEYRERRALSFERLLLLMLPLFAGSYLVTLLTSKQLHDAHTPLDSGHLFPLVPPCQLFLLGVLFRTVDGRKPGKIDARLLATLYLLLYMVIISQSWIRTANDIHYRGIGYANVEWAQSEGMRYVESLPDSIRVVTNAADAVYFLSGRDVDMLPWKFNPTSRRLNSRFEEEMAEVRDAVLSGRSQVLLFDTISWRWYLPSEEEISSQLPELKRLADATVYGVERDGQAETFRELPLSSGSED